MLNLKIANVLSKHALLQCYPVGSYYWSSSSTSPATLFGGTWEQIKDKFVYAAGAKTVNSTGGEENHTLTIAEMPSHQHKLTLKDYGTDTASGVQWGSGTTYKKYAYSSDMIEPVGGGSSHNNMPPYITAYCWHRTA